MKHNYYQLLVVSKQQKQYIYSLIYIMTNNNYDFDDLEKLVNKISKIRKKIYLEKIRDIIIECNPNIKITENTNGLFFHFHNLTTETYDNISLLLKKIDKKKKSYDNDFVSTECPYRSSSIDNTFDTKIKYSNREKNIIKRKIYDQALDLNNSLSDIDEYGVFDPAESYTPTSNIFIKKNRVTNT